MQNAFVESFNGRLRDEFLNETLFTSLSQACLALEDWRRDYNNVRPHSRIGWLAPAAYAANFSPHQAKALRSARAPRLGQQLQLCKMATARLSVRLDKRRGQRHRLCAATDSGFARFCTALPALPKPNYGAIECSDPA